MSLKISRMFQCWEMSDLNHIDQKLFERIEEYLDGRMDNEEQVAFEVKMKAEPQLEQEVELDCDYGLKYRYTINALTAITGYVENGQQHKLIEKVRFTPVSKP